MVQKRPLVGDDSCFVSAKHPKFEDSNTQLVSVLEFPSKELGWKPYTSGVYCCFELFSEILCN